MVGVISLGKARKQAVRKAKVAQAEANTVRFGRSRGQKQAEAVAIARQKATLDGQTRE